MIRAGQIIRPVLPPSVHAWDVTTITGITTTSPVAGSPQLDVTFTAPPSGQVLAIVGGGVRTTGTGRCFVSYEIRENDVSGAVVQVASAVINNIGSAGVAANFQYLSRAIVVPSDGSGLTAPLTPGGTYFARTMHWVSASTGEVFNRDLTIAPLPFGLPYRAGGVIRAGDWPPIVDSFDPATLLNISGATTTSPDPGDPEHVLEFIAPTSGRVLLVTSAGLRDNTGSNRIRIAPEVRIGGASGPLVQPIADTSIWVVRGFSNADSATTSNYQYGSRVAFLGWPATEPLIPGQQYYARTLLTAGGTTTDVFAREMLAIPVS